MEKTKTIAEYGDFQTPSHLACEVCRLMAAQGIKPASIIEPTCGLGRFLFAALDAFPTVTKAIGLDINDGYIRRAGEVLGQRPDALKVGLAEADFFTVDWGKVVGQLPQPILVLGNLPWVTNAHLEVLGSRNLPKKSNFQGRVGFDAITGKANFDISEWMLIRLLESMSGRLGTLAMLCKSAVARKALFHGWKNNIFLRGSSIHRIDAALHFDAAVDAALLVTHFAPIAPETTAKVYVHLNDIGPYTTIGMEGGQLFADIDAFHRHKHLCGEEVLKWRSGIKHDCSKVMEFRREGERYRNGLGELVELEDNYIYPMLKSSGVAGGGGKDDIRRMLVTQRNVGDDTAEIERKAPKTWAYLQRHSGILAKRGSSIYKKRPSFSVFGVGEYSFSPWKVAISGFYKKLVFLKIGLEKEKPIVLDDTSYFLSCRNAAEADYLCELLNSKTAQAFYAAFVFWDAKRPITADLLRKLDLRRLARELGSEEMFCTLFGLQGPKKPSRARRKIELSPQLWT